MSFDAAARAGGLTLGAEPPNLMHQLAGGQVMLKMLGLDSAEASPLRSVMLEREASPEQVRVAEFISQQIAAEQTLSANRLTWNLTFQGFTIAGYALVSTADASAPARIVIQLLIALVSITISLASLGGIVASQRQRAYLRRSWTENGLSAVYPEPFSDTRGSRLGRAPATWICLVLVAMWLALIPASYFFADKRDEPIKVEVSPRSIELRLAPATVHGAPPLGPPVGHERSPAPPPEPR